MTESVIKKPCVLEYTIKQLSYEEGGGWLVESTKYTGCSGHGPNLKLAVKSLQASIEMYQKSMAENEEKKEDTK